MVNRRPTPELIAARKWEIKRRYDKRAKVGKRSRGMAAIRVSELTRWMQDEYGAGVELEPNARSERIIRTFAHHFMALPAGPRRLSAWYDLYCPWLSLRDREYFISEATYCPLRWSADKLAWILRLIDAKRTELKIKTIGAIDCNREQRELRRKAKRKARDALRYKAKRCSPNISI
jgi:hypothetical protein